MKITHLIIGLGIGGAELMLKGLVEALNEKDGMQHSVISLTSLGPVGSQLQAVGINVKTLGMKNILSLPITFLKLRSELKKQMPDIVHTWMYHADFLGGLAAKSLGISNIIWGIRTTDVTLGRSKFTILLRKICAFLSYTIPKTIVCAAETARKVHVHVGYDSKKMKVIHNGFDLNTLKATSEQRKKLREKLGYTNEHKVIGSVGRFNPIKNQQAFVEMASLIIPYQPNARFLMIGRDNTWKNIQLVNWIKKYNLEDKFCLLGERSDVAICLAAMDVFCLHSKTEGFPNALGEAMAMGVPCVATDVGDTQILLENFGKIVKCNALDLSNGVLETLKTEKKILDENSAYLFNKIKKNFSIENTIKNYSNLYLNG